MPMAKRKHAPPDRAWLVWDKTTPSQGMLTGWRRYGIELDEAA